MFVFGRWSLLWRFTSVFSIGKLLYHLNQFCLGQCFRLYRIEPLKVVKQRLNCRHFEE